MNIYTFKLTKKHLVAAVLIATALIALLILAIPGEETAETAASVTIKTPQDCVQYLSQMGYQLDAASCRSKRCKSPRPLMRCMRPITRCRKSADLTYPNTPEKRRISPPGR